MLRHTGGLTIAFMLLASGWLVSIAHAQGAPGRDAKSTAADAQDAERRKILESDEWRQANRSFNEWLSVQQIYRPEEVDAIKAEMKERIAHMSPQELRDFLKDMQKRLKVLTSPEAEDARLWLKQFMAVARNPEQQLGRNRPDVLNMTASQIRQEILWLQQERENRLQAQAAFDRTQNIQSQIGRNELNARQASRQPVNRSNWPANTPRTRSRYWPRREVLPMTPNPIYMIGPWGTPYFRVGQTAPMHLR
jgi:hypothetical protein